MRLLLVLILIACLSSRYISFALDSFQFEKSCGEKCLIPEKILLNFVMEYVADDTSFLSFIVSKEATTPFQEELLDNLYMDAIPSRYSYNTMHVLNSTNNRRRHHPFNIIFVKDSETLEYVICFIQDIFSKYFSKNVFFS